MTEGDPVEIMGIAVVGIQIWLLILICSINRIFNFQRVFPVEKYGSAYLDFDL